MKQINSLILGIAMLLTLAACGTAQTPSTDSTPNTSVNDGAGETNPSQTTTEVSKVLIAYFSVPEDVDTTGVDAVASASVVVADGQTQGNTEYVANIVQQTIGGDLFRIETVDAYPATHDPLLDYAHNEKTENARPELTAHIEEPDTYDVIILGFPNWNADLPMPIYTFLEEYDFSGKMIIPFVTHGGSGLSNTKDTIARLQPDATVSDNTLSISRNNVASSMDEVIEWANSLGIKDNAVSSAAGSTLVAYFAYSENMGDTSGMSVDAVTSASLNRDTNNTEGNLQVMAREISENKNAEIFSILMEEPFDPDYSTMLDGAIQQIQNGTLPPLQAQVENLDQYDVVFLGIPVWSNQLPPAVLTFLSENDLSGKTVVPFGIHLGSRFGRMIDQIEELCPDATVLDGFTVNAATANDEVKASVGEWLDALEID